MHQRLRPLANAAGAALFLATLGGATLAADSGGNTLRRTAEPAAWQGPTLTAQIVPPAARDSVAPSANAPSAVSSPANPGSAEIVTPSSTPKQYESPLLDGKLPSEELLPPVVAEGSSEEGGHQGVQPYGGGHPTDWSWGCGGNPYRTGPGLCDNYKVGPRWHVSVDGIVLHRDSADLAEMLSNSLNGMPASFPANIGPNGNGIIGDPSLEQFGYGPGGRISFTSQVSRCAGYDIQAVYEGVNDWNASIVFPKTILDPAFYPPAGTTTVTTVTTTTNPPNTTTVETTTGPIVTAPAPFPEGYQQRSLHYYSTLNSGELNFLRNCDPEWRPFCGVRYIRFDDKISDVLDQEVQPPLPFASGNVDNGQFLGISETDRFNQFHVDNNLMGFQIGVFHDTIQLNDRFAFEGFVNGGVYYNRIKYSNTTSVQTTQFVGDDTSTTGFNEQRTDTSPAANGDSRDLSEISYEAEASLTAVCRLNKCWALRAGYQVLWINHLHTAESAYLGDAETSTDLLFHGWHAGFECRR